MRSFLVMILAVILLSLGACAQTALQAPPEREIEAVLTLKNVEVDHVVVRATISSKEPTDVCVWTGNPGKRISIFADSASDWLGSSVLRNDESVSFDVLAPAAYSWPKGWSFLRLSPGQVVSFTEKLQFTDYSADIARRKAVRMEAILRGKTSIPADHYVVQLRFRIYNCEDIPTNLRVEADDLDKFDAPFVLAVSAKTRPFPIDN